MALFEGISLDPSTRNSSRTFLSSVGGFSQPSRKQIRSLQDLLQTIQRFDLQYFRGADLDHVKYVGEGISYKVSCNEHKGSGRLFAVKQVKLPSAATNLVAFERQVECVLRDVEVMSWLSIHENVLNLIGYGWDILSSGHIPFLVTEYADAGSLRQFLRQCCVSAHERVVLCRDVINGLQALHNCGIAHGDIKLDNILAIPWSPETAIGNTSVDFKLRSHRIKACVSDFGHALQLVPGTEDVAGWERYGGTLAYNAPEISAIDDKPYKRLDFRKCDIWSLGLLCWEVMRNGQEFFNHWEIQRAVTSTSSLRSSNTLVGTSDFMTAQTSSQPSTSPLAAELVSAAPTFARLACKEMASIWMDTALSPRTIERLREMFRLTLRVRPEERAADITSLPFSISSAIQMMAPEASATLFQPSEESSWSFEVFRRLRIVPHEVRQNILNDSKRIASTHEKESAKKAAFQAGIAYISGFGCEYETSKALYWLSLSATKGSELAQCFLPFFENDICGIRGMTPARCFKGLLRGSLAANSSKDLHDHREVQTDGTHHALEVKFQLACQSGNVEEVRSLQSIQLNGNERDGWNSCPLHWIFMFPEENIEEVAQLIVFEMKTHDAYRNAVTSSYISIDPQLPVTLSGTPLAFATAVSSMTAVRALLHVGADPLVGNYSDLFKGSAWYIACKYHLTDILRLFLEFTEELPYTMRASERGPYFLRLFKCSAVAFSEATLSDRVFLHGSRTTQAAGRTVLLLLHHFAPIFRAEELSFIHNSDEWFNTFSIRSFPFLSGEEWTSGDNRTQNADEQVLGFIQANIIAAICIPLIQSADAETIRVVLEAVGDDVRDMRWGRRILNRLLYRCTTRACDGTLNTDESRKILQACLNAGADVNGKVDGHLFGFPINRVVRRGNASIFEWFIQQGADVTARNAQGDTPLHFAISYGFSTVVDLSVILALGASPEIENEEGVSPLHIAILTNREDDLRAMLGHIIGSGMTPRYQSLVDLASVHDNTEILSHILDTARKGPFSAELDLSQALANAIEKEQIRNVRVLVSSGAPVSEPIPSSWSCLHMAVFHGFEDSVRELLRADCVQIDRLCVWPEHCRTFDMGLFSHVLDSCTALQVAVLVPRSRNCARLLIDAGADVTIEDAGGTTLVEFAVQQPRFGDWQSLAIKLLLKNRIKASILSQRGLIIQDIEWATALFRSGLLEDLVNRSESSLLHLLADIHQRPDHTKQDHFTGMSNLTKMIIMAGAEPDQANEEGYTSLELSVLRNNEALCAALLEYYTNELSEDERTERPSAGRLCGCIVGRESKSLERAWSHAVRSRAWAYICAFHQAGIMLSTAELNFDDGCALFQYAYKNNIQATLRLFVGSHDGSSHPKPDWDPHLHQFWQIIYAVERVISGCGNHVMDLRTGYGDKFNLGKMEDLGYYEAQTDESFKEVYVEVRIDSENPPELEIPGPDFFEQIFELP